MEWVIMGLLGLCLWAGHTIGVARHREGLYAWAGFGVWIVLNALLHQPL